MDYRARIEAIVRRDMPSDEVLRRHGEIGDDRIDGGVPEAEILEKGKDLRLAAVLVPLVEHADEPSILLTRRADHLDKHSGQVAFPGGKVEADDDSPVATALREAEEEIGLDPAHVEVAGFLNTYQTGTGFLILPVVGFVRPGFTLTPDTNEVADIFEVPARLALDADLYQRQSAFWQGKERHFYSMDFEGYNIWGATAGMLVHLSRRIAG